MNSGLNNSTHDFVAKVVVELEQLGLHRWDIGLFEWNKSCLEICEQRRHTNKTDK
jgi:hypothetical protein